jgi:hypothetical protein
LYRIGVGVLLIVRVTLRHLGLANGLAAGSLMPLVRLFAFTSL